jgi:tetratricopeptide (TPR) repeat protein
MYYDEEDGYFESNFNEELDRFEKSLNGEPLGFMDSDAIEALIDHYLIQGNYTKANLCAQLGIDQFPFNHLFQLRKAQAISANGQLREALTILSHLERVSETSCEHYLTKAAIFSQLRDSKTAVKYFQEALNISEPEDKDEIFIDLAMEYEAMRDYSGAIKVLQEALLNNTNNEVAIYELAFCYDQLQEYDKAIKCYSDFINENPYSFTAWYNLGNAYSKLENYEKAVWAFDYCVLINQDFSPAYFNLGNTFLSLDKYRRAIENFERCIELDGDDGMCYCYIGECYEQLGELAKATENYRKSLDLMPDLGDAYLGLGIVKDLEGNIEEAIELIKKAITLDENNASYYHVLAGALEKTNRTEETNETYLKALGYEIENEEILIDYVSFLNELEEHSKALHFLVAYNVDNKEVEFYKDLLLGVQYFTYFDIDQGISLILQCVVEDEEKSREIFSLFPSLLNESKVVNLFSN